MLAEWVLKQLPAELLLPQLIEVLAGEEQSDGSSLPTAAYLFREAMALIAFCQLGRGAGLAMKLIPDTSETGEQQVMAAMQQLARDAGRMREQQQVEAAGHVAWVAAAQARQEGVAEQQQLQREWEAMQLEKQQLRQQRDSLGLKQQQLQQEREVLQAECQQLEQLREGVGQQRKRRQLS
jgi:hypothetical protein